MIKRLFWALLFWPVLSFANSPIINKMIFFGDSLTDTGNLYRYLGHILPKSPPYYEGHFSDGSVWAEHLYKHYFPKRDDFSAYNYAVGGASAVFSLHAPLPYTLAGEITDYLLLHDDKDKANILYVIWIGGNNYLYAPSNSEGITTRVVEGIATQVEKLIRRGGKYFFIPNLPDMGTTPYGYEHETSEQLSQLSTLHNQKLAAKLAELQQKYPEAVLVEFNVGRIFDEFYQHPARYNITHLKEPCFAGGYVFRFRGNDSQSMNYLSELLSSHEIHLSQVEQAALLDNPVLSEALSNGVAADYLGEKEQSCEHYLYFDHIHPTHVMHTYLAEFAIETLNSAGFMFKDAAE